jgi:methylmalonyl-CoA/ethylmalonyl-CoA epimerase
MVADSRTGRLHHVGLICPDREQAEALLAVLGLEAGREQYVEEYQADCIFTKGPGAGVEIIIPRGGTLTKFNKGAGGLHHIAIQVHDLRASARALQGEGIELLENEPVPAGDLLINFVPPAFTRGVIVELVQEVEGKEGTGSSG